jgi:hypothetical protein
MPSPNSLAALRLVPTPMLIVGGLHLAVLWAATRNGVPFEQWLTLRVVFRFQER